MGNTKLEPGPFDAFDKAREDEPIFVLLGRDHAAPAAITKWAHLRRNRAIKDFAPGSDELVEELRQCADAEAIALQMDDWRKGYSHEDQPPAERVAHSGVMGESQEQRDHSRKLSEAVGHLREAEYHISEARAALTGIGIVTLNLYGQDMLIEAQQLVATVDELVAPKRPGVQPVPPTPDPVAPSFAAQCPHGEPLANRCADCEREHREMTA